MIPHTHVFQHIATKTTGELILGCGYCQKVVEAIPKDVEPEHQFG